MIPEVVALEKKLGTIKGSEKDHYLDQIIDNLRQKSKLGKLWENAEKAREESIASMAKEDEEKKKINDVVQKVIQDSMPKKTKMDGDKDKDSKDKDNSKDESEKSEKSKKKKKESPDEDDDSKEKEDKEKDENDDDKDDEEKLKEKAKEKKKK